MIEYEKKLICINGRLMEYEFVDRDFASTPSSIYEVIRVIDGVPVFFEEHINRLKKSCESTNSTFDFEKTTIKEGVSLLIKSHNNKDGNIEIIVLRPNADHKEAFYIARYLPHKYPSEEDYANGVKTLFYYSERVRPEVKAKNIPLRDAADLIIRNQNIYEVILVNRQGIITEGSRSNIFFIKDNVLYTAPEHLILNGISRQIVIKLAHYYGFTVKETGISYDSIHNYQAAFLTGTSPKILPIYRLENQIFDTQYGLMRKLMTVFDETIKLYIQEEKA